MQDYVNQVQDKVLSVQNYENPCFLQNHSQIREKYSLTLSYYFSSFSSVTSALMV